MLEYDKDAFVAPLYGSELVKPADYAKSFGARAIHPHYAQILNHPDIVARANELGMTMDDILIIASIIEREAGRLDEMGYVSSVIHNRLNAGMRLQMDSTLNYIAEMTGEEFSLESDNPYNTYMYDGLPEGAIANPGLDSIYAALHPESTNYYYFALGADGFTHFFTNYDAFLAFTNSDEYGG